MDFVVTAMGSEHPVLACAAQALAGIDNDPGAQGAFGFESLRFLPDLVRVFGNDNEGEKAEADEDSAY